MAASAADQFRPLNDFERAVIARLLDADKSWHDSLRGQLETASLRSWPECAEHCPSVEFLIEDEPSPKSTSAVLPVQGWFTDTDGVSVEILLFERAGRLADLEFVVYSDRMKREPDVAEIEVRVSAPP